MTPPATPASPLAPDEILPLYQRAAHDENGWVRMLAMRGLGQAALRQAPPSAALLELLYHGLDDSMPPVRAAAAEALSAWMQPVDPSAPSRAALSADQQAEVRRRLLAAGPFNEERPAL
jgi:HEAT repeat protein